MTPPRCPHSDDRHRRCKLLAGHAGEHVAATDVPDVAMTHDNSPAVVIGLGLRAHYGHTLARLNHAKERAKALDAELRTARNDVQALEEQLNAWVCLGLHLTGKDFRNDDNIPF